MLRKYGRFSDRAPARQSGLPDSLFCPAMIFELKAERPEFQAVEVKIVDENREKAFADSLDYWYVPTYFVDGVKVHEGVPTVDKVRKVYERALDL